MQIILILNLLCFASLHFIDVAFFFFFFYKLKVCDSHSLRKSINSLSQQHHILIKQCAFFFFLDIKLPHTWTSLVAQTVKRLSTMWEI